MRAALRIACCAWLLACCNAKAPPPPPPSIAYYTCAMHPGVRARAGGSCPLCGMSLTKVERGDLESGSILVDPVRRQRFGVRTAPVERRSLTREIRAFGTVRWEKSRVHDVTVRGDTWIEHLHVSQPGTWVRRGQPLALIYSPMLYAAQRELIASRGSERELSKHERLKLLGLSPAQVEKLASSGVVSETTDLLAPASGVIVELEAVEGTHLMEGTRFARIARLDEVWIEAEVYQDDVGLVKVGAALTALAPGSSKPVNGTVDRVEPWLDAESRRAKVRATVPNPDQVLLPNMAVQVVMLADLGEQVAVPADAVITTGTRRIVFVDAGRDRLVPRDVQVGRRAGPFLEVRGGLQPGETVVTSGAFLVASESRIRASETYWGREPEQAPVAPGAPEEAPVALRTPELPVLAAPHRPPETWAQQLAAIIDAYLATKDALVKGDPGAAAAAAGRMKAAVAAMPGGALEGEPARAWAAQAKVLARAGDEIARATRLEQQRDSFFALSGAAYAAAWSFEHPRRPLYLQRCPMAFPDRGGSYWLSSEPEIRNPYFGDAMLGCGEVRRTLR